MSLRCSSLMVVDYAKSGLPYTIPVRDVIGLSRRHVLWTLVHNFIDDFVGLLIGLLLLGLGLVK